MPTDLDPTMSVYIAGHRGLVGSAIWRLMSKRGFSDLRGMSSTELDLREREETFAYLERTRPEVLILAAARVGGILANSTYPTEFLSDNLRVQVNVLDAAKEFGVRRLLFLGSSCIYPRHAPQPISEDSLLTGPLEPTNDAYAIAKIAGVLHIQALRREYGLAYISAMPTNLYGPNDNFDLSSAHVLPALIRRIDAAHREHAETITVWGTGSPRREFMHVDDMARGCLHLLEHYDAPEPINIGTGSDVSIGELARIVSDVVGYEGTITYDTTKPDGTVQKLLDVSQLSALGWKAQIGLEDGIAATYRWYLEHRADHSVRTGPPASRR